MAGIEKRIADLEAVFAGATRDPQARAVERERLVSDFAGRTLDAMASIRRAPIDPESYRYSLKKIGGEGPMTIAAHVAALAHLEHEDETAARAILGEKVKKRGLNLAPFEKLIDAFAVLKRS